MHAQCNNCMWDSKVSQVKLRARLFFKTVHVAILVLLHGSIVCIIYTTQVSIQVCCCILYISIASYIIKSCNKFCNTIASLARLITEVIFVVVYILHFVLCFV